MPSLYDITVPVFTRTLRNLDHLLAKAAESGVDEQSLLEARLAPDMLPLTRQVQIACDTAKLAVTRLAQAEPRPMADEETSPHRTEGPHRPDDRLSSGKLIPPRSRVVRPPRSRSSSRTSKCRSPVRAW